MKYQVKVYFMNGQSMELAYFTSILDAVIFTDAYKQHFQGAVLRIKEKEELDF